MSSYWSRRIADGHRLVHRLDDEGSILIISCRHRYE